MPLSTTHLSRTLSRFVAPLALLAVLLAASLATPAVHITHTAYAAPAPAVAFEASSQRAGNVTYQFGSDVTAEDATLIRNAIALAQRAIGDAGSFTVRAGAAYNADQGSHDIMGDAEPGQLTLYTATDAWREEPKSVLVQVVIHEYFHVLQYHLARTLDLQTEEVDEDEVDPEGPRWLIEGAAVYVAARVAHDAGLASYAEERETRIDHIVELTLTLRDVETLAQTSSEDTSDAPYSLGMLAAELLAGSVPSDPYLLGYWKALGEAHPYPVAFQRAFGMTLDQFYPRFEQLRRNGFR